MPPTFPTPLATCTKVAIRRLHDALHRLHAVDLGGPFTDTYVMLTLWPVSHLTPPEFLKNGWAID